VIPWWGWVIIAVVAMAGIYGTVALLFFHKASKRVFRTFDDVRDAHFTVDPREPWGGKDPFDDPFFHGSARRTSGHAPTPPEDRVKRMTGPGRDPFFKDQPKRK
jgi:hypothetical protein